MRGSPRLVRVDVACVQRWQRGEEQLLADNSCAPARAQGTAAYPFIFQMRSWVMELV